MRRGALVLAAAQAALVLAASKAALAQAWPGGLQASPEVQAALVKVRAGDARDLTRLAEGGRADAQFYLGNLMIFGGGGAPKDGAKGCAYLAKASAVHAEAMHLVGECYQYGYGGEKNLEKAIATFHKAGDMGFPKSRCAEGNVLLELGRDEAHAVNLCREGAEAGDPDAQTDLGNFYLMGQHVPKDAVAARGWYEKAVARNKQPNAAFVLGQIYWNGDGIPKDNAKAAFYWRIAYDGGRQDAAKFLGDEAFVRAGIKSGEWKISGLEEARGWYEKAAGVGPPAMQAEAAERAKLMAQIRDVMVRHGQGR